MNKTQIWGGAIPPFLISSGCTTDATQSIAGTSTTGDGEVEVVENTIYFSTTITESSVHKFNTELRKLDLDLACKALKYGIEAIPIKVHINSDGGLIVCGTSAMDNMLNCRMPIHTIVDGVCASAATFLSVVGSRRFMFKHSYMLIHQLRGGMYGSYFELTDQKTNLDQFMNFIKKLYIDRTNVPESELDGLLEHDLLWDADTCLKYGLVDEII